MADYYVYIYLDSRKPGKFVYGEFEFDYEPFYVGKGKGDRFRRHLFFYKKYKTHFYLKLKKIIEEGFQPIILKHFEELTEEESFLKERNLIEIIGREISGGPFVNQSDGGEGQSGFKHKLETRTKISESLKKNEKFQAYMKTEEYRSKLSNSLKGHGGYGKGIPRTDEVKRKISESTSYEYVIKCPSDEVIQIKGGKNVYEYFSDINKKQNQNYNKKISAYGILYGKGSKGYILVSKKLVKK